MNYTKVKGKVIDGVNYVIVNFSDDINMKINLEEQKLHQQLFNFLNNIKKQNQKETK